jgi:integrase
MRSREFPSEEFIALRWDMVDLKQGLLHVNRLKNGIASVHPLRGPELRALRKLARDYLDTPYVFVTERKGPLTPDTVRKLSLRAGEAAKIGFPVHPHMLRHACGQPERKRGGAGVATKREEGAQMLVELSRRVVTVTRVTHDA